MNQQTLSIILICAGALWGIFELFKRLPKDATPEPKVVKGDESPIVVEDPSELYYETPGVMFFLGLLNQIQQTEDERTKRHLIEAGKSYLENFSGEPTNDGNSPNT